MIAVGLVARVVVAFKTYGVRYDIDSLTMVREALASGPLDLYSDVNSGPTNRWPYLSGYLPLVALAGWVADATGTAFHGLTQLPQILADLAIAWFVQDFLGRRGHGERTRLAAAALVVLGPAFWMTSGYHGQVDSVAILPAVVALWLWDRSPPGARRALVAGALIGVGVSVKTVPLVMLVALLPSAVSNRERLALVAPALLVPLVAMAPFLIEDFDGVRHSLEGHRALPGIGGISLVVQPELANAWLHPGSGTELSALSRTLHDHQAWFVAALMAPFVAVVLVRRVAATMAAALLWAALLVFGVGFAHQYVLWALPFALMAGYLWQVAAVQAALFVPAAMMYWHPFDGAPAEVYTPIMIGVWAVLAVTLVVWAVRLARAGPPQRGATPRAPAIATGGGA